MTLHCALDLFSEMNIRPMLKESISKGSEDMERKRNGQEIVTDGGLTDKGHSNNPLSVSRRWKGYILSF